MPKALGCAVVLYVCTLPFEAMDLGSATGLLSLARLAAAPLVLLSFLYPRACFLTPPAAAGWFFLYLFVYFLSGLVRVPDVLDEWIPRLMTYGQLMVVFWISSRLLIDQTLALRVALSYAASASLVSTAMLLDVPGFSQIEVSRNASRVSALGFNPNLLSCLLAIAAVVPLSLILHKREWNFPKKAFLILLLIPLIGGILATGSRGGMAAFALGVSVFFLPLGRKSRKLMAVGMASCVILALVFLAMKDPDARSRWEDAVEGNLAGREEIFPVAVEMITEKPLLGWGSIEAYYELGRRLNYGGKRDAHNLLLDLFIETGLLGTTPFLIGLGLVGRAAWKARDGFHGVLPLAMLVVLLAGNMFSAFTLEKVMWFVIAFSLSAQAAATSRMRHSLPEPHVGSWVHS